MRGKVKITESGNVIMNTNIQDIRKYNDLMTRGIEDKLFFLDYFKIRISNRTPSLITDAQTAFYYPVCQRNGVKSESI